MGVDAVCSCNELCHDCALFLRMVAHAAVAVGEGKLGLGS